ncbi:hypothetical protein ROZALSC1DRAFT_28245 [Rozella allomycis CSF55]|uniref:Uncharacterized protein n=1 Tax=Rozella allomycis (strain CSF55) TaxID=988480 RepID=A0A4P9YKV1_ROZAC|nr:hypothetical protein ROZALSC1DRAFT_28245 [Rozella allomycis CSF55]
MICQLDLCVGSFAAKKTVLQKDPSCNIELITFCVLAEYRSVLFNSNILEEIEEFINRSIDVEVKAISVKCKNDDSYLADLFKKNNYVEADQVSSADEFSKSTFTLIKTFPITN